MQDVHLKRLAANRIKHGYPVLTDLDFYDKAGAQEGDIVRLLDPQKSYVATGYLGYENRNSGWVLSWEDEKIDQDFFRQKLQAAKDYRQAFYANSDTNAFRVFNGDGDGIGGLTIDYYAGYYVISWYNQGLYQLRSKLVPLIASVFQDGLGFYEKNNFPDAPVKSQHLQGDQAPEPLLVKENGLTYATYLNDGWMTGIFLDQRDLRYDLMTRFGPGRRVLNLFSYTGAFSVAASMGGAVHTVNVDVAKRSKKLTAEQFSLNALDPDQHEIRVIDVDSYLDYAKKHHLTFGLIVIDPPTFARTDAGTWQVEEDYSRVIKDCLSILDRDGILIASTNAWQVSKDEFYKLIERGFDQAGCDGLVVEEYGLPQDYRVRETFPESHYLKVFALQKDE